MINDVFKTIKLMFWYDIIEWLTKIFASPYIHLSIIFA